MITQLTQLLGNIQLLVIAGMFTAGTFAASWAAFRRGGSIMAGITVLFGMILMLAIVASADWLKTKTEEDLRNGGNVAPAGQTGEVGG